MGSRIRWAARAVAAVVPVGVLLASCSSSHSSSRQASAADSLIPQGSYVALGDSYTSGAGIPDPAGDPRGCWRSTHDYPALVAQSLHIGKGDVHDVSCQGATIADLSASQSTGDGTNPAQLDALSAGTSLVTLGIGGNDVDFVSTLTRCATFDLAPALIGGKASDIAPCRDSYTTGGTDRIKQKIDATAGHLDEVLKQIRGRAPHARILVVGYPALFPAGGAACAHTFGITPGDVGFLNDKEVQFNSMLRQHATAAGAEYVDTYTPSVGHDACSDPDTRWIEPLVPALPAAPLHPNARGAQGMADAIARAVGTTAAS
ncbi:SGNH/GDSL hydrolase family protein [Catenulispora rubra]|uniref:SGNH/GDSL hydrolase family protein n=1 Tax=Catenulispora rubra TaxID=280293 RepID=UPI002B266303|nr:SGNH/GDSL hydrolase family protein [Catenulispora rubra]